MTPKLAAAFLAVTDLSPLGFSPERLLANQASRTIEALEALRAAERGARTVGRLLEFLAAPRISTVASDLLEQLRREGEGSM
jgi:hypothetical protein